ncbi:MAG: TPM domain-containing protein [Verrucomicrobiota bacterium]|nr:TPM domain-containing protein [Verrucomicrobiota bacterium]
MKCPSCSIPFSGPALKCPNCNLTLQQLDTKFGALPLHSRFLTDRTGQLPLRAIAKLRQLLSLFERKFPQSLFSVFIIGPVQGGTISEYTFWLANRGRFNSLEATAGENFDLLLGIDTRAREAALVIGYGLESYLTERDLQQALTEAAHAFRVGDYARGIRNCVEFMIDRMRDIVKEIEGIIASDPALLPRGEAVK